MTVSLLTITHGRIGYELLTSAKTMLSKLPMRCESLSVSDTCDPDKLLNKATTLCNSLNDGDGVLVFTDIFGSTPSNICNKLNALENIHVIAGVNLPMLIRVMNYPTLSLDELVEKAISGAHDGIIDC